MCLHPEMCRLGDSKSNEADNGNGPAGDLLPAVSDQHYVLCPGTKPEGASPQVSPRPLSTHIQCQHIGLKERRIQQGSLQVTTPRLLCFQPSTEQGGYPHLAGSASGQKPSGTMGSSATQVDSAQAHTPERWEFDGNPVQGILSGMEQVTPESLQDNVTGGRSFQSHEGQAEKASRKKSWILQ